MKKTIVKLLMGMMACSGLALADYTLDFSVPALSQFGTISYAGGTAPLVGSGITVSDLTSISSPANNNVQLACTSCQLNFTTGNFVSSGPGGTDYFAGGGSFQLAGTLAGIGVSGVLMSGTFDATATVLSGGIFKIASAFFTNNVNAGITNYFAMPATPPLYGGAFNILFLGLTGTNGSLQSLQILGGDIATSVPEPASMILLGTVLLGCATIARRRFV